MLPRIASAVAASRRIRSSSFAAKSCPTAQGRTSLTREFACACHERLPRVLLLPKVDHQLGSTVPSNRKFASTPGASESIRRVASRSPRARSVLACSLAAGVQRDTGACRTSSSRPRAKEIRSVSTSSGPPLGCGIDPGRLGLHEREDISDHVTPMARRCVDKHRACILQTADVPVRPSRKDRVLSRRRVVRIKRTCIPSASAALIASRKFSRATDTASCPRKKERRLLAESGRRELIQPRLHKIRSKIPSGDRCGKRELRRSKRLKHPPL